jgi:hypothetical protein
MTARMRRGMTPLEKKGATTNIPNIRIRMSRKI